MCSQTLYFCQTSQTKRSRDVIEALEKEHLLCGFVGGCVLVGSCGCLTVVEGVFMSL